MSDVTNQLESSFITGFIDKQHHSGGSYQSQLIMNDIERTPMLSNVILEQLSHCTSFTFQIAFITGGGLALLKSKLRDLKNKGVEGRLLTSDYLHFNRPKMFRELLKIDNLEVKISHQTGFHAKGYMFDFSEHKSLIIGSSNLTATALKTNRELNVLFHSTHDGMVVDKFENTFESNWDAATPLSTTWIKDYQERWEQGLGSTSRLLDIAPYELEQTIPNLTIVPNKMQKEALENLSQLRMDGKQRAVLISATGTGKTYLSAFDVKAFKPARCLYVAHREQILRRSIESFKRVLNLEDCEVGLLSGNSKASAENFVFATVQSLAKEKHLSKFGPEDFDYIIIDEVHRAGAKSYERLFSHFRPKFMLGMSATPERTDDFNIFELFDHNIAYEIRLQRALDEHLLVPFHYYGVRDFEIDGELMDEQRVLNQVQHEERMNHVMDSVDYYGHSGDELRCLMFCSSKKEGKLIVEYLNKHHRPAVFLSGEDSQDVRLKHVQELESGRLQFIVTVDIFNEGIDIPSINQVVMLRQTKSSIVFIQQLGRGLRLNPGKDYLVVIDFIGNYRNNFMIPMALSGDNSHNKDTLRKFVSDSAYLTGLSSVNFESVVKEQIYQSINRAVLGSLKDMKEAYRQLKQRLNRVPFPTDFVNHHSIDPLLITRKMTYSEFLRKNNEPGFDFSELQERFLAFFGNELLNGFRVHEFELLDSLIDKSQVSIEGEIERLEAAGYANARNSVLSSLRVLSLDFFASRTRSKYATTGGFVTYHNDTLRFTPEIITALESPPFNRLCRDLIKCARLKNQSLQVKNGLQPYKKYGRKDVCRLLNWQDDETATMYGYRTKYNTCPIFITYHKKDDIEESVKYGDELLNRRTLRWFTRSRRTLQTGEVKEILNHQRLGINIHVLIKKDDDEGSAFYYLGEAKVVPTSAKEETMNDKHGKNVSVVTMNLVFEDEIPMNVYEYLTGKTE